MARLRTATGVAPRTLPSLNRWHAIALATFLGVVGLPVGAMIAGALVSLVDSTPAVALEVVGRAAMGTAAASLASTAVGLAIGIPLADALAALRGLSGRVLRFAAWLPLAVPPVAYALGIRRLLELFGQADMIEVASNGWGALLPVVLAQSPVTIAITCAALASARLARPDGGLTGNDLARVLGAPLPLRSWFADPEGMRKGLVVAVCLGMLHGLTSLAAPLVFPSATSISLGGTVLRLTPGSAGASMLAALPFMATVPLLLLARRQAVPISDSPRRHPEASIPQATARTLAMACVVVVLGYAVLPPAAVLFTGLGPTAVGALLLNAAGIEFAGLATSTFALLLASCLGGLLPLVLTTPDAVDYSRRGALPWLALAVPPLGVVAGGAALGISMGGGILLHVSLGFMAALPVFAQAWARTPRGALDGARVLGASTVQTLWWEDGAAFARLGAAAISGAVLASVGDLAMAATANDERGRYLGGALAALLTTQGAERGAYTFGALLTIAGVAGLLALEAGRAATTPIWWRR